MVQAYHPADAGARKALDTQIVQDQLEDIKAGLWVSMPISAALSTLILAMDHISAGGWKALIWFAFVNIINGARLALASGSRAAAPQRQLNQLKALSLISGFCWSYLAILTAGYTQESSTFHLLILAGICAGAVTYSGSCASVSVNFIAPPLVITAIALLLQQSFESFALTLAVCLFLGGLVRSAYMTEARFKELSRLRREAELFAHEMERNSREDHLTGLLNRRGFEHRLSALRDMKGTFAIMAIDFDGFKNVNDTYGHRSGDELLAEIARRIAAWAPPHAILARIGGSEFAVLDSVEENSNLTEADVAKLIGSITNPYPSAPSARIGACIGIYTTSDLDAREMLRHADIALYAAKAQGRNSFYFFDKELGNQLKRRQHIERDLLAAIHSGELTVWFQPIVNLDSGKVAGFEALLRWSHPVQGAISPPEVVTAAREIGSLAALTEMVFSNCCRLLKQLNKSGPPGIKIAMNLSPLELEITDPDKAILAKLRQMKIPASQLEIEITEESSLDYERVNGKLKSLANAGVSIALDDFGTGFSTFSSIKNGWINKIKIDKEFVGGSTTSLDDAQLVKSVIDLGKALGIQVSAEGVETEASARLLRSLGCKLAQGFLYSKPVPFAKVRATIERIEAAPAITS